MSLKESMMLEVSAAILPAAFRDVHSGGVSRGSDYRDVGRAGIDERVAHASVSHT